MEIAEVAVAFLMVLIVILILFGFWAGFRAERILKQRILQKFWIYRSLKQIRWFGTFLRYAEPARQVEIPGKATVEMISIPKNKPRRGRHPTHSLDRWMPVVHAWENRDTLRNTMTLSEYLCEQFGTYADGSPKMSENSYYEWKKKVLEELRRQELRKKGIAQSEK